MTRYNINLDRCDKDVTLFMKSYTKRVIKKNCKQTRKELNSADTKFRPTEALVFRGNKISAAFEQNKNNYCTAPPSNRTFRKSRGLGRNLFDWLEVLHGDFDKFDTFRY